MNIIKKLSILIVCIICTACGSSTSGLDELKMLCEKDAGLTIYKTVEAEGYYDATGSNTIVAETDYRFIEFCDENPTFVDAIPEPGCWRVSKVKRESGQCYERLDKRLAKIVVEPYPEFLKDNCIAVEKIEKPEADYKYEVEREEWWINESAGTKMRRYTGKIINTKTGGTHGEAISYSLYPGWLHSETRSKFKSAIGCGSYHVTGMNKTIPFAAGLIEKTLLPKSDKSTGESK